MEPRRRTPRSPPEGDKYPVTLIFRCDLHGLALPAGQWWVSRSGDLYCRFRSPEELRTTLDLMEAIRRRQGEGSQPQLL